MNSIPQALSTRAEFEFQLFGQAQFFHKNIELNLSVRKVLALMAYLVVEGSGSRSVLAGLLWTQLDEASARRNLRQRLYRLSPPELGACVLVEANRVSLASLVASDVARFDLAMLELRFSDAVELYRGLFLDGLELEEASAFHEWLDLKREAFERAFQRALAGLADQLERRGESLAALAQHLRLIELNPLLELHQRHVMRLRTLLGQSSQALQGFEDFKVLLEIELGLLPAPETLDLAVQIRAQGRLEVQLPGRVDIQGLAAQNNNLIGRELELHALEQAWQAGKLMFVSGEPGIGKSRLLSEFSSGKRVFRILGRPGDTAVPFATLTRTIRGLLELNPKLNIPPWIRKELARLVPSLDEVSASAQAESRIRLFDAFSDFLFLTTLDLNTILIDDLQFFDTDSFEMLIHAFNRVDRPENKRIVIAYRSAELTPAMNAALEQLLKSGSSLQIELEPLDQSAIQSLIQNLFGSQEPKLFAERLHRATGGNPFFALETLKSLVESKVLRQDAHGDWGTVFDDTTQSYAELPMPETVIAAVRERVARLGVNASRLLESASLAGDAFSLEDLQSATTLTEFEALEAFELALNLRILERQAVGYRFSHDLIREALAFGLGVERARLLHRKLAENLEKYGGAAARIALHLENAGQQLRAAPWRVKAALAAIQVFSNREAVAEYEKALEDDPRATLERAGILDALVVLLWRQNLIEPAMNCVLEVASIRAVLDDQVGLARADIWIGVMQLTLGHRDLARASLERALARAQSVHAIAEQLSALFNLVKFHTDDGNVSAAKPMIEMALSFGTDLPLDERAQFEMARTYCALLEGNLGQAISFSTIGIRSAEDCGVAFSHCNALLLAVDVYLGIGSTNGVEALLESILELIERHEFGYHRVEYGVKKAWLELLRGNAQLALKDSLSLASFDVIQPEDQAFVSWVVAKSYLHLHNPQAALEMLALIKDAPTLEVWTRILTVRLNCALELGLKLDAYIQAAKTQLESERTPALESLELRLALARALKTSGDLETASGEHNIANAAISSMAATLEAHPALQASFFEKQRESRTSSRA